MLLLIVAAGCSSTADKKGAACTSAFISDATITSAIDSVKTNPSADAGFLKKESGMLLHSGGQKMAQLPSFSAFVKNNYIADPVKRKVSIQKNKQIF